ncbi:hypothetical protein [Halotia branconii]|uniref:Uncharacterized protein n=1 Tax=Halotia branconii CENA392 TaxID=1539056 RepID=A0AAJ6NR64_9CYAN|nr:hypothetical protein [Halotia branconii]WGV24999.1 hypothetical protein QI031_25060 [Halotia branconii CENA392]
MQQKAKLLQRFDSVTFRVPTHKVLARRNEKVIIYTLVSFNTNTLSQFGTVRNIAANNDIGAAIAMAQYIDESINVGWGFDTNKFGWRVNIL